MSSYETQFRAIVGDNHKPSDHLDSDQAQALSAQIFGMPDVQIVRNGFFIQYEGWSIDQDVYLSVSVTDDHLSGTRALCEPSMDIERVVGADS
ncbi:hypothetical protein [Rhizobium sp. Leaf341]|uniref:hypothetical protein n=1 Tax=Rhizobium sp. Leaf341 TaxID=1736344 RepID=UPI000712B5C8|nr:hypothetical protein [Rhizobium sp. Leaf341]KQR77562.1 hypothetical protein ASG03_14225 [Rhizobium sp. Leaf341]